MFLKFSTAASMFILAMVEAQELNIPDVIDTDKPVEPESTSDVQPNSDN